jgi:hypothetical protein
MNKLENHLPQNSLDNSYTNKDVVGRMGTLHGFNFTGSLEDYGHDSTCYLTGSVKNEK